MALLNLVYAPDPIFKQVSPPVDTIDDTVRDLIHDMFETLEFEQGVGMAAPMVGILQRIAVVNLNEDNTPNPYCFINPEIIWRSDDTQTFEEASLCFVGISADIPRAKAITVRYLDESGAEQELTAEGFFAHVIQHEIDYLDGITFIDHLSRLKRDMLLKKMAKILKHNPPHVHGVECSH